MTTQVPSIAALSAGSATADEDTCTAFNAAFRELGFHWRWTVDTYWALAHIPSERDRIRIYLETEQPHLLMMYDADFLIDAIHSAKVRCQGSICTSDDDGSPVVG